MNHPPDGPDLRAPGPHLHADARGHFIGSMGFTHEIDDEHGWGAATITPYLTIPGTSWPWLSVLLTFADVLVGRLAGQRTAPRISITSDLNVRMLGPPPANGRIEMRARLVKKGRSVSAGETEFHPAGGSRLVASSLGTFMASPRPMDDVPLGELMRPMRFQAPTPPLVEPLTERVGLRVVEPGETEIALRDDLSNATASLQGGLVALVAEVAAQTATTAAAGGAVQIVDSLDVRYLAAARVGPCRASAEVQASDANRAAVRVEVRDHGRDDRLAALVLVTTRPG